MIVYIIYMYIVFRFFFLIFFFWFLERLLNSSFSLYVFHQTGEVVATTKYVMSRTITITLSHTHTQAR